MELDAREVAGVTVISVHAERIDAAAAIRIIGTCCCGSFRRGCGDDGLEFENMEIARCLKSRGAPADEPRRAR